MQCIEQTGRMYGLQLNWNKLEVLPMRCEARVRTPNGNLVISKESLIYVGSFSCENGSVGPELNTRLGAARAEFETFSRVWHHAALPKSEKIRNFGSLGNIEIVVLSAHSMAEQSRTEKTQCFSIKMLQENPQHPALL